LLTVVGCSGGPTAPPPTLGFGQLPVAVTGTWDPALPTEIKVAFSNQSQVSYGLNPCFRDLGRLDGDRWLAVDEANRICAQYLIVFKPGDSLPLGTDLPPALGPGHYRFRFHLASPAGEADLLIASTPFEIPE